MRGVADLEDWEVAEFFRLSEDEWDDEFLSDFLFFLSLSDRLLCLL